MMRKFPSPCGDYGSYRGHKKHTPLKILNCFRPLAGIMVLIPDRSHYDRRSNETCRC